MINVSVKIASYSSSMTDYDYVKSFKITLTKEILALHAITLHNRDENDDVRQRQKGEFVAHFDWHFFILISAKQLQLAGDLQTPAGV